MVIKRNFVGLLFCFFFNIFLAGFLCFVIGFSNKMFRIPLFSQMFFDDIRLFFKHMILSIVLPDSPRLSKGNIFLPFSIVVTTKA